MREKHEKNISVSLEYEMVCSLSDRLTLRIWFRLFSFWCPVLSNVIVVSYIDFLSYPFKYSTTSGDSESWRSSETTDVFISLLRAFKWVNCISATHGFPWISHALCHFLALPQKSHPYWWQRVIYTARTNHPMACACWSIKPNLIGWTPLKKSQMGAIRVGPSCCTALIHFLFPEGRSLWGSEGWCCTTR